MDLSTAERGRQAAQREADIDTLDGLLHPRVVGVGPDGTVFGKEDDLASYRSGALRMRRLDEESLDVQEQRLTGVTSLVANVEAVQGGQDLSARLRCTRLWLRDGDGWRVLAATFVPAWSPGDRPALHSCNGGSCALASCQPQAASRRSTR